MRRKDRQRLIQSESLGNKIEQTNKKVIGVYDPVEHKNREEDDFIFASFEETDEEDDVEDKKGSSEDSEMGIWLLIIFMALVVTGGVLLYRFYL